MEIDFLKMRGCGDDAVVLSADRVPLEAHARFPFLAQRILDRRLGVGGTTLIILGTAEDAELAVRSLDPDGDESGLPCNAARCAARYASDSGAIAKSDFFIATAQGRLRVQIIDSVNVRADMGLPFNRETRDEIRESPRESFTRSILVEGRMVSYTPISLGRPYAMLFVPDFSFPLRATARAIAAQPDFPDSTGIGFVQVFSREEMRLRVWEATGEPPGDECACAAAAMVAAVVNGFTDRELFVHLKSGDVFIQWEESDNHIWLTGPAGYVFTGTYDFAEEAKE